MEEIKVGEYVRTNVGEIGKVIEVTKNYCRKDDGFKIWFAPWKELKHSKNIIDLIECGDILEIKEGDDICYLGLAKDTITVTYTDIKEIIENKECELLSILTHEQFEQNSYKV